MADKVITWRSQTVIVEMRVYRCAPGRMPALQERFAKHTLGFFKKHGIEPLGFWAANA
jgi:hypothetical protein